MREADRHQSVAEYLQSSALISFLGLPLGIGSRVRAERGSEVGRVVRFENGHVTVETPNGKEFLAMEGDLELVRDFESIDLA